MAGARPRPWPPSSRDLAASFTLIALTTSLPDIGKRTLAATGPGRRPGRGDRPGAYPALQARPRALPPCPGAARTACRGSHFRGRPLRSGHVPGPGAGHGRGPGGRPADIPKLADILLAGRPPRKAEPRAGASIRRDAGIVRESAWSASVAAPSSRPPTVGFHQAATDASAKRDQPGGKRASLPSRAGDAFPPPVPPSQHP
jgi:hypothetical protein